MTAKDMISYAKEGNASKFQDSFKAVVSSYVSNAIEEKRKTMYAPISESVDENA